MKNNFVATNEYFHLVRNVYKKKIFLYEFNSINFNFIENYNFLKKKKYLVSSPYYQYRGIDSLQYNMLFNDEVFLNYIDKKKIHYVIDKFIQKRNLEKNDIFATYILDLKPFLSKDDFLKKMKSKTRNLVKKSLKSKIVFKFDNHPNHFYQIYLDRMKRFGSPPHPKKYFNELLSNFNTKAKILTGYFNDKPLCSAFLIINENTISVPFASSLEESKKYSANMGMYYNLINYGIENKMHFFDFGRSEINSNNAMFKLQWDSVPYPIVVRKIIFNKKFCQSIEIKQKKISVFFKFILKFNKYIPIFIFKIFGYFTRKYLLI